MPHPNLATFFPSSDSFYDSGIHVPLIETPHLPILLLYLCFSPWVSDLGRAAKSKFQTYFSDSKPMPFESPCHKKNKLDADWTYLIKIVKNRRE